MRLYNDLYRAARGALRPLHRRARLHKVAALDLGQGLPRRRGRALVSYVSDFVCHVTRQVSPTLWERADADESLDRLCTGKYAGHYHHREAADLVLQLIQRRFIVDCIYDRDGYLIEDPTKYDFILDEWNNMSRWAGQNPKARKLFHGTTCHWLYWNRAELQRLDWFLRRKGVCLSPERQLPPMGHAESDLVTYYGSNAALPHYGPNRSKLRKVWVCPTLQSHEFRPKDWSTAKRRFLYFGSASWVHRGLDLVIEAFAKMNLELFICGPDDRYQAFYTEELKNHHNLRPVGFVTPGSPEFLKLVDSCTGVVYASAAEGCSTSIVQCLQFGLIPIVTDSVGLSVHDFWPALKGDTDHELMADLVRRCTELSERPDQELAELSRWFWEFAQKNHSRPAFRQSLNTVLDELLEK